MLDNLKAQLTMPTFAILVVIGWLVLNGVRMDRFDAKIMADYHANHLQNLTLNDCGGLTYRIGEVFPSICLKILAPADRETVQTYSGHSTNYRGAGPFIFVDDRYIKYLCAELACRVIEYYPDKSRASSWSETRQCWISRQDEKPLSPQTDPTTDSANAASPQIVNGVAMPTFQAVPTVEKFQPLGQLTSTNC